MNIVAKSDLNFQGKAIVPVSGLTGIWLTSSELADALQYKSAKSVTNLFNQNADEFTSGMTQVIESVTSGNYRKKVRVFSLRGAHLIAMFARTDVAKEFRRWVLDILDREVTTGNVSPAFDFAMYAHNARVADRHLAVIYKEWRENLKPALRAVGSPIANNLDDRIKAIGSITCGLASALSKHEIKGKIH